MKMYRFRYVAELLPPDEEGLPLLRTTLDSSGNSYTAHAVAGWSIAQKMLRQHAHEMARPLVPGDLVKVSRYDLTTQSRVLIPEVRLYEWHESGLFVRLSIVKRALAVCRN